MDDKQNNELIEHVFRHEYGKIIALLTHKFGPYNIEKIEDKKIRLFHRGKGANMILNSF